MVHHSHFPFVNMVSWFFPAMVAVQRQCDCLGEGGWSLCSDLGFLPFTVVLGSVFGSVLVFLLVWVVFGLS